MNNNFLKAAISYFGLTDTHVQVSEVFTEAGNLVFAVRLGLTDEDVAGIAERMRVVQAGALADAHTALTGVVHPPSEQRMRDEYNGMDKRSKSEFGSFSRYKAWRLGGGAEVTDKVELPAHVAHVYMRPSECTPLQKAMALGVDERGNYAIAVEDLTVDQQKAHIPEVMQAHAQGAADRLRAEYERRTVEATGRLTGADGKPTSNADDFSGLPG